MTAHDREAAVEALAEALHRLYCEPMGFRDGHVGVMDDGGCEGRADKALAALARYLSTDTGEGLREALRQCFFYFDPDTRPTDAFLDEWTGILFRAALSTGAPGLDEDVIVRSRMHVREASQDLAAVADELDDLAAHLASPGEPEGGSR